MLPKIIGLTGFAGSGKDTVANYFIQQHGYQKIAMADALKDVLSIIFGWPRHMLEGSTKESRLWRDEVDMFWTKELQMTITPRVAMQMIGTDLFRNFLNTEIWCMIVKKRLLTTSSNIIIPDIRFANEIQLIREYDADIIEVQRGVKPEWYDIASNENINTVVSIDQSMKVLYPKIHESEYKWIGINNANHIIENNTSLVDLHNKLSDLYGK